MHYGIFRLRIYSLRQLKGREKSLPSQLEVNVLIIRYCRDLNVAEK